MPRAPAPLYACLLVLCAFVPTLPGKPLRPLAERNLVAHTAAGRQLGGAGAGGGARGWKASSEPSQVGSRLGSTSARWGASELRAPPRAIFGRRSPPGLRRSLPFLGKQPCPTADPVRVRPRPVRGEGRSRPEFGPGLCTPWHKAALVGGRGRRASGRRRVMSPLPWSRDGKDTWRCETWSLSWSQSGSHGYPGGLVSWNFGCSCPHSKSKSFTTPWPTAFL